MLKGYEIKPIVKQKKGFVSKMVFIELEKICACGYADFAIPVCETPKFVKMAHLMCHLTEADTKDFLTYKI